MKCKLAKHVSKVQQTLHDSSGIYWERYLLCAVQDDARSFKAIACWALDAAFELCQEATHSQEIPGHLQGVSTTQQESLSPPMQHEASQLKRCGIAAQVLPWLAHCLAARGAVASKLSGSTDLSTTRDHPAAAQQVTGRVNEVGAGMEIAERVVRLYYSLCRELGSASAPAAAFALAQLLQADIRALLMGDAASQGEVRGM